MGVFDWLTSTALSLTVSGNTGISPFLTLLLLGCIERSDPTLLNMDGWIEALLSSWISIIVLAILTLLEFIGKCVPVVDEIIDSVEVFVVPVLSIFSSLGTMGVLDLAAESVSGDRRHLGSTSDSLLMFFKVVLVIVGIVLALAIHFFKMLIRMIGLASCAGCCQPCITITEICIVVSGVLLAIFIRQIAIVTLILLLAAAGYAVKKKFFDKDENENEAPAPATPSGQTASPALARNDEENPPTLPAATGQPAAPPEKESTPEQASDTPPPINPEFVQIETIQNSSDQDDGAIEIEATPVEAKENKAA